MAAVPRRSLWGHGYGGGVRQRPPRERFMGPPQGSGAAGFYASLEEMRRMSMKVDRMDAQVRILTRQMVQLQEQVIGGSNAGNFMGPRVMSPVPSGYSSYEDADERTQLVAQQLHHRTGARDLDMAAGPGSRRPNRGGSPMTRPNMAHISKLVDDTVQRRIEDLHEQIREYIDNLLSGAPMGGYGGYDAGQRSFSDPNLLQQQGMGPRSFSDPNLLYPQNPWQDPGQNIFSRSPNAILARGQSQRLSTQERSGSRKSSHAEDLPMDMWGSALVVIFKDFPDLVSGLADWYTYTKIGVLIGCQVVNLCLQCFFLYVVWQNVVTPAKVQIQKDYAEFHQEVFRADGTFDHAEWNKWSGPIMSLCKSAMANPTFTAFVMFVWILRMLHEMTDTATLSKNIFRLPDLQQGASVTDMVMEEEDKDVVLALTPSIKLCAYAFVVGPKFVICIVLSYVGLEWLAATENLTDLILSALALEFIIKIDELVLFSLVPPTVIADLRRAAFAHHVDEAQVLQDKLSEWTKTLWSFLVTVIVVGLYLMYFQLVLPGFLHDISPKCAGPVMEHVYALTCEGVGSLFGGPTCFPFGNQDDRIGASLEDQGSSSQPQRMSSANSTTATQSMRDSQKQTTQAHREHNEHAEYNTTSKPETNTPNEAATASPDDAAAATSGPSSLEVTTTITPVAGLCKDIPHWSDNDGFSCEHYTDVPTRCSKAKDRTGSTEESALEACCACGGGRRWASDYHLVRAGFVESGCLERGGVCAPACSDNTKVHAVRCCSSTAIEGWSNSLCADVWQESDVWGGTMDDSDGCQEFTYGKAEPFCESKGGRLCIDSEIDRGCVRNSGCGFDSKLIWTSTPCSVSGAEHV